LSAFISYSISESGDSSSGSGGSTGGGGPSTPTSKDEPGTDNPDTGAGTDNPGTGKIWTNRTDKKSPLTGDNSAAGTSDAESTGNAVDIVAVIIKHRRKMTAGSPA